MATLLCSHILHPSGPDKVSSHLLAMAQQPKKSRAIEATALLDEVQEKLHETRKFFKDDQTSLIAGICTSEHYTDPRMVFSSGRKGQQPMGELFKRMLAIRFLSMKYEEWLLQYRPLGGQYQANSPANHGLCTHFIREQSLPNTSQVRNWFLWGQKLLRIEREVGIPGISLVLTCVLPKFPHFNDPEVINAIHLLKDDSYPGVKHMAEKFTVELDGLQDFYTKRIGSITIWARQCIQSANCARNTYVSPTPPVS